MKTPCNSYPCLRDAIAAAGTPAPGDLIGSADRVALTGLLRGSAVASGVADLRGRSVLIAAADPLLAALALIELDGLARRMILVPPGLPREHLPYVMQHGEVDVVLSDGTYLGAATGRTVPHAALTTRLVPHVRADRDRLPTEWVLLTSGTTGRPKMVLHTLASLSGAIAAGATQGGATWGTFYDIRRYGGLQIYLRAVLAGSSLLLAGPDEPVAQYLRRAGEAGVTHLSGTPSHWRQALMSGEARRIAPRYVRLSGEIADQAILDGLRAAYPDAAISHAFATTEAGVAFDVRDGRSGFPASLLAGTPGVELKVVDATLRVRSGRTAERYLGENPPVLKDADGFVDTGDVVELCDGRYQFRGRRDGVINVGGLKVHPEEVEAVLNRHPQVRLSLVRKKRSPITGALVVADVLLKDARAADGEQARALQQSITQFCRAALAPHQVPAAVRFVPALAVAETGKLVRHDG